MIFKKALGGGWGAKPSIIWELGFYGLIWRKIASGLWLECNPDPHCINIYHEHSTLNKEIDINKSWMFQNRDEHEKIGCWRCFRYTRSRLSVTLSCKLHSYGILQIIWGTIESLGVCELFKSICSYIVISTKIHLKNYSCYYDILKVIMITNFIFVWKLVEKQG